VGKFVRECRVSDKTSSLATVFAVALLLALSVALCPAAEAPVSADPQQSGLLGVGDWITLQISGQPDATSVYVASDGTINVPLVGNIPVAGVAPVEAASRVAKALKDGGYFVNPSVTAVVTQPNSQFVSVVGEVQTQGRYPITPRTKLVDLLAQAGGVKETASDIGYVLRSDETGQVTRHPVSLNVAASTGNAQSTWTLMGGDSLVVPRADHFSVVGEVTTPGRYRIEPGMTIMQALALAGGITERGSERRIQVKRVEKPGQYRTINAKPGDLVKADDIIRVKESIF
jgi:polysaccharide export outer membrane protein